MAVNGLTKLVLPTLEKRFQLSSQDVGLIAASNDISALVLVCFVSFYGGHGNKICWLGYGALITGSHSFVFVYLGVRLTKLLEISTQKKTNHQEE